MSLYPQLLKKRKSAPLLRVFPWNRRRPARLCFFQGSLYYLSMNTGFGYSFTHEGSSPWTEARS